MGAPLKSLTIQGFKSIRNLENFQLDKLNVLIGANGSGKSNFLELFRLLSAMTREDGLREYVEGAGDDYLFGGPKVTEKIAVKMLFGQNGYDFELTSTPQGFLMIRNETTHYFGHGGVTTKRIGGSSFDSALLTARKEPGVYWEHGPAYYVYESLKSWKTYHFHDTSKESALRRYNDFVVLKTLDSRGVGLASLLYYLQTERYDSYQEIVRCLRLALPFFDDFVLEPNSKNKILLNWRQKGLREYALNPTQFSDGSLRFICLVAALLQPELPTTLVIDEPELGLHPAAIGLLAELIQGASQRTQIVVATQSAPFLDYFKPENVIVANRSAGESTFTRLEASDLNVWLEDYTLGELWNRNILAGGPVYER